MKKGQKSQKNKVDSALFSAHKKRKKRDKINYLHLIEKVGSYPKILINKITRFLNPKDTVVLSMANKHFYKNMNDIKGVQQKIEVTKIELNDEIYSVLNDIAYKQVEEVLSSVEIKKVTSSDSSNTRKYLIISKLKKACC